MYGKKTPTGVRRGAISVHFWCIFLDKEKAYKIENQYLVGFILRREREYFVIFSSYPCGATPCNSMQYKKRPLHLLSPYVRILSLGIVYFLLSNCFISISLTASRSAILLSFSSINACKFAVFSSSAPTE